MDKCQKIVHPLEKGAVDYQCGKPYYKDGWCKLHHPEIVAAKEKQHAEDSAKWKAEKELRAREKEAQRLFDLAQLEKGGLTIENAIVLLVQSGYRVEKLPPNADMRGSALPQHQLTERRTMPTTELNNAADAQSRSMDGLADKRDAERYRFLRYDDRDDGLGVYALKDGYPIEKGWMMTEEMDDAIDAAMAANVKLRGRAL